MVTDRSLDDFSGDADADRDDGDGDQGNAGAEPESGDQTDANAAADEAVTATAAWTTDGADCDRCGESVSRRWRDGDALVCAGCMSWER